MNKGTDKLPRSQPFVRTISRSTPNPNFPGLVDLKTRPESSSISTRCSPPVRSSVLGTFFSDHRAPFSSAHEMRDSASWSDRVSRASPKPCGSVGQISRMPESTSAGVNPSAWRAGSSGNMGALPPIPVFSSLFNDLGWRLFFCCLGRILFRGL